MNGLKDESSLSELPKCKFFFPRLPKFHIAQFQALVPHSWPLKLFTKKSLSFRAGPVPSFRSTSAFQEQIRLGYSWTDVILS